MSPRAVRAMHIPRSRGAKPKLAVIWVLEGARSDIGDPNACVVLQVETAGDRKPIAKLELDYEDRDHLLRALRSTRGAS